MNDFLKSLFAPMFVKVGTWALRQDLGKDRGNDKIAQNAPLIGALAQAGASAAAGAAAPALDTLAGKVAAQKDVQKVTAALGIPSTSQAILGVTLDAIDAHPTLNLSDTSALKLFLASRILGGG